MFLLNSRYRFFTATSSRSACESLYASEALLFPKLRSQFAEFLNEGSLMRLRILSLPTCVGLRYNHHVCSLRGFSWQCGLSQFVELSSSSSPLDVYMGARICLLSPSTGLNQDNQSLDGLPSCVPPSLKRSHGGTGILTCFPSPTPLGLGLGID